MDGVTLSIRLVRLFQGVIKGEFFAMEAHMVHKSTNGELLVIGFIFDIKPITLS